jgi:hypothetical protein
VRDAPRYSVAVQLNKENSALEADGTDAVQREQRVAIEHNLDVPAPAPLGRMPFAGSFCGGAATWSV